MATILVTGANRGLGLEFIKHYLDRGDHVIGTFRDKHSSGELIQMGVTYDKLEIISLDVSSEKSLKTFPNLLGDIAIDIFINNAGVYGPRNSSFKHVDIETWIPALKINTIAPIILTQLIIDNLKKGSKKKLIYITSKMGSIDDNSGGGSYVYRSTKAALNAVVKSLSIDLKSEEMIVALLHPGWVQTDMGGPNGLIDKNTSVSGMIKVIDGLERSESGCFLDYTGSDIPW